MIESMLSALADFYRRFPFFLMIGLIGLLAACQSPRSSPSSQKTPLPPRKDSQLVLNRATLEQANNKGQILWKIQVESAVYTPDKQKAHLTKVRGNLFQAGKLVLQVSANNGEIYRNGENIRLNNNVLAIDPRNKASLRSNAVEWNPKQSLLDISQPLRGSHKDLTVVAQQGQYNAQRQQLTLSGKIEAVAPNPRLQLQTDLLLWDLAQHKAIASQPIHITRFEGKTITDQLDAQSAEVNLQQKIAIAKNKVEFKSIEPPVQAIAEILQWDYQNRQIQSDRPIKLVQYRDQITITANQANVNLISRIAHLSQGVQGINDRKPAKLFAQNVTWNIDTHAIEAQGNVIYEQSQPKFNLTGEKATGTLNTNNITVQGNARDRVVTEIFPNKP